MKLAIYTLTVNCPDDWDDSDWSDEQHRVLEDTIVGPALQAVEKAIISKFPELKLTISD